jgi:GDP-4-dehydro-6-deoxy-D-mannose reductase
MRVLVTGASGFVGRWLTAELEGRGHHPIATPPAAELDVTDPGAVAQLITDTRPDGVVHLAAIAYAGSAAAGPRIAIRTNVEGWLNVLDACRAADPDLPVVLASSSEVYAASGTPEPLRESAPLGPRAFYGYTKLAAEGVARLAASRGQRVCVVRPFNHTGPGQQPPYVVPALAQRILDARHEGRRAIPVGNMHVRRDIGDVRDTVRAYALLLELMAGRDPSGEVLSVNVATGTPTRLADIANRLAESAGWPVELVTDPTLVRADEPEYIVGDASLLHELTGWVPQRGLSDTLADVLGALEADGSGSAGT